MVCSLESWHSRVGLFQGSPHVNSVFEKVKHLSFHFDIGEHNPVLASLFQNVMLFELSWCTANLPLIW